MTSDELLQKLKDIQPPAEPAWWLLGPAWQWLALAVAVLFGAGWLLWRRRRDQQLARLARRELQQIAGAYRLDRDTRRLAQGLSRWLKQVAMLAFPERQLQAMNGETWLEFLDLDFADRPFSRGCGRVFGAEVYRRDIAVDAGRLLNLSERWLAALKPRLQARGDAR